MAEVPCDQIRQQGQLPAETMADGSLASWLSEVHQASNFFFSWREECLAHNVPRGRPNRPAQPAAQPTVQQSERQPTTKDAAGKDGDGSNNDQDGSRKKEE